MSRALWIAQALRRVRQGGPRGQTGSALWEPLDLMGSFCPFLAGLAEVMAGLGVEKLEKLMPEIVATASKVDIAPHVRDGYIMMFNYLPITFGDKFTPYVGPIIPCILKVGTSENAEDRITEEGRTHALSQRARAPRQLGLGGRSPHPALQGVPFPLRFGCLGGGSSG